MNFRECIDCEKRYPACQGNCESYLAAKRLQKERNDKIRQAKDKEARDRGYIQEHYNRTRRK